jgi:hypothetical protein
MTQVNKNTIVNTILVVLFGVVLLKMLPSLIPLASNAAADLFTTLGNNTASGVGVEAAAFATEVPSILGWFWIVSPVILVIGLALGMFAYGKGKGRG